MTRLQGIQTTGECSKPSGREAGMLRPSYGMLGSLEGTIKCNSVVFIVAQKLDLKARFYRN